MIRLSLHHLDIDPNNVNDSSNVFENSHGAIRVSHLENLEPTGYVRYGNGNVTFGGQDSYAQTTSE